MKSLSNLRVARSSRRKEALTLSPAHSDTLQNLSLLTSAAAGAGGVFARTFRALRDLWVLMLAVTISGLALQMASAAPPITAETASRPGQITLKYQGKPVMVYEFAPYAFKAYVKKLYTLRGDNVLRDSPADHLHHHALMYGIKVNGVNFWEEISGSGVQRVVRTAEPVSGTSTDGLPQAVLTQELAWVQAVDAFLPATNAPSLLNEIRTLTLTIDDKAGEVALHWRSRFTVGTKTNTVVLTGSNYHGLGMRFLQELDGVAVHISPAGKPDLSNNRQDVTAFPWEAVTFDTPGKPATIAVFGAPGNARGNPRFFAMRTAFPYLAATQGLDQEPLVYRAGDTFELNYLVTLYPEMKTAEALSERARRFASQTK